jgi:hypothetical protein
MPNPHRPVDAILISADPNLVTVDDAIRHLAEHDELYWEVGFQIATDTISAMSFPIYGFIHIKGEEVEYRATIRNIIPFEPEHYENEAQAAQFKPEPWLMEWKDNVNNIRSHPWKQALVITEIVPFAYDTYAFEKYEGGKVTHPPEGYIRVVPPEHPLHSGIPRLVRPRLLHERNLEDFMLEQLDVIEPGLRLVSRQLSTPAGRLDLLCKDANGHYVVVELKRGQTADQVLGQVLRYMGWVIDAHHTEQVRGIVVVGKKDQALSYALMAAPNVRVKEFKIQVA